MKRKKLGLERLETRDTPAAFGIPWSDAQNITLSFAPDSTQISGASSTLFAHMQADGLSTSAWEGQVLRAVQSWTSRGNLNIGVVSDSGADLSTAGLAQGDPRFGDIRIGMRALDPSVLALTTPPAGVADTSGGDIILNSNLHFSVGAKAGSYDLYSVVAHELGHSLGLTDNTTASSVMCESFQGIRTGISALDVTSLDALYGARKADAFDTGHRNTTLATASALSFSSAGVLYVRGDITTSSDVDYYKFTTPAKKAMQGSAAFDLTSTGISLLAADVSLLDSGGHVLATYSSGGSPGTLLTFSQTLSSSTTYYLTVKPTAGSAFNVGAYEASIVLTPATGTAAADPITQVIAPTYATDGGTSQTFATATTLQPVAGTTSQAHYRQFAQLSDSSDSNFFKVKSPTTTTGKTNLLVSIRSMSMGLPPILQFTDATGKVLQAQQVSGTLAGRVYELTNVPAGTTYGIQVVSAGFLVALKYEVEADFLTTTVVQTPAATGTLSSTNTTMYHTLVINQPQLISCSLLAQASGASSPSYVWMQLYDKAGNTIGLWLAQTGLISTESLLLQPGEYAFKIWARFDSGDTGLTYSLSLSSVSDPIGVALADPTLMAPTCATAPMAATTSSTGNTTTATTPFTVATYPPSYYAWLGVPMS